MKTRPGYRWFVVAVFFLFMLLHQADKLMISPLTTPIMETFGINEVQMGAVSTGALLVGAFLFLIWGYLYDRFSRPRLLALASFIWGSTTWLSAIAPTFPTFFATRASTGIDDSSYPGLYSLIADYFGPAIRGRVFGLIQLAQPLGYMLGLILATLLADQIGGWRNVFLITGSFGLFLALIIFFGVKEVPRGRSEPELANLDQIGIHRFDPRAARALFQKRSLLFLFVQGFVGFFPWQVISFWFFRYLETERNYSTETIFLTMAPTVLVLASGYFVGGFLGDFFFKRTPRGRMLVSMVSVLLGAVLLIFTLRIPVENQGLFTGMLMLTALFIPFASPNVTSTVNDVSLPEVRSTALAVMYFLENVGAAIAPLLAGIIAVQFSLETAIRSISVTAWVIGSILLGMTAWLVPHDIQTLHRQLQERAEIEQSVAQDKSKTSPGNTQPADL